MTRKERIRVLRTDGKPIHLLAKRGHLMVCAKGCCCGRTERGHAGVPVDFYKQQYKERKLRKHVQMTMSGCLGPCPLSNVVLLFFDGQPIWFQAINTEPLIVALFDYLEQLLAADGYVPPPPELAEYVFTYYGWSAPTGLPMADAATPAACSVEKEAGLFFLTHADTDLLTLQRAAAQLPEGSPPVRAISLNRIGSDEHMEAVLSAYLPSSRVLIARVLGGMQSVPGLRKLADRARAQGRQLILVSGLGTLDPELTAASTVPANVVHDVAAYLQAGGVANFDNLLRYLSDHFFLTGHGCEPPAALPEHGVYHPDLASTSLEAWQARHDATKPTVGVLFYRSHWMSGNLAFIDEIIRTLEKRGANALAVFTSSLKATRACGDAGKERRGDGETDGQRPAAFDYFVSTLAQHAAPASDCAHIDVLITTVSFALGASDPDSPTPFDRLGVPVLQAICAGAARWQWESSPRGLNPLDTAMNVALPEFDGRIITAPISFKETANAGQDARVPAAHYVAVPDRVERVVDLALRFATLRRKPNERKRIAFVLTNSPGKAARIGNAVGLDAPASLMHVLEAMKQAGYVVNDLPADGDTLIHSLIERCSYDETILTSAQLANAAGQVDAKKYSRWFAELPESQRTRMTQQWGEAPGEAYVHEGKIALAGLELGNVFIALQPPRGYGMDPNAIYHQPDLPPPHNYYALYRWLRDDWRADAIVHLGKHGTLEWLPGKSIGLSGECFPDTFLADLPLFYPFILNDPGEGAQAKRRGHAVIVDHLTPPMTSADAHGPLAQLMQLVDEYYQVEMLDPTKLPLVQQQIWNLIQDAHLEEDLKFLLTQAHDGHTHEWDEGTTDEGTPLSIAQMRGMDVAHMVEELDGYLCELAGAQIRDGLHILGQVPDGEQLVGLLNALTRLPNLKVPGLRASVATLLGLDLKELLDEPGQRRQVGADIEKLADRPLATSADVLETIDELSRHLLAVFARHEFREAEIDAVVGQVFNLPRDNGDVVKILRFVCRRLMPALQRTTEEITNLLAGLEGKHVPAGPSGAPTRGMAHVLPTGRNFYAVDPRGLPSFAAWQIGQQLAHAVLDRHQRETGTYPESIGISVWGTSAMRTHGDDVAQILALLGVRPVWQQESQRVTGIEVIPLAELGRPRIDITIRISGFFRDAFPHLIELLDNAVKAVLRRNESEEENFVRKHYLREVAEAVVAGVSRGRARRQARYRIFGSKPGSYGAGLLPLIDERNWQDDVDFARAYVNWGGYAYTASEQGVDARETFQQRLSAVDVAVHNQDNREHDIFDSDDYFQFHGGMIASIRSLTGRQPRHYFGDSQDPAHPRVRDLKEEVLRVFRTRVTNPKWLESIARHGYKGGLELAATVDYLFGYDATARVVDDWMYEQVAARYALDPQMQKFLEQSNPWALHGMAERLLEAAQRGLWAQPDAATLEALRETLLDSEALLEMRGE